MAFQQGLSGLNSSSKALDVISHNVANASTVGFKAGRANFADVYAASMGYTGASNMQIGMGSQVSAVVQQFTQSSLTVTNYPLDMAIDGNGFFRMQRTDGTIAYTRNGQFTLDKNGFVVNDGGDKLTGFAAVGDGSDGIFEGATSTIQVDSSNMAPNATTSATLGLNLDSNSVNPLDRTPPGQDINNFLSNVTIPPDSFNFTHSIDVYDSLGNKSSMQLYFVRDQGGPPAPNTWQVFGRLSNDVMPDPADPSQSLGTPLENMGTIAFTDQGIFDQAASTGHPFTFTRSAAELNTGAAQLTYTVDLSNSSQWNASSSVTTAPRQDGYTTGKLQGFTVSKDGVLQGSYSNGLVRNIAQIALADFSNPNGLVSLGGNLWAESYDSGQPIVGPANSGSLGNVLSARVEESNVDLTQELVNMIIQQRNYQANAQSIRTQDQMMQTIVNLR